MQVLEICINGTSTRQNLYPGKILSEDNFEKPGTTQRFH